jgi:hypothetical protein
MSGSWQQIIEYLVIGLVALLSPFLWRRARRRRDRENAEVSAILRRRTD